MDETAPETVNFSVLWWYSYSGGNMAGVNMHMI